MQTTNQSTENRVAEFRRIRKLTQEELAAILKIQRTYLSDIERGVAKPSLDLSKKISKALRKPFTDIFLF